MYYFIAQATNTCVANAWSELGAMYENGSGGMPKDEKKAAAHFAFGVENGNNKAKYHLGHMVRSYTDTALFFSCSPPGYTCRKISNPVLVVAVHGRARRCQRQEQRGISFQGGCRLWFLQRLVPPGHSAREEGPIQGNRPVEQSRSARSRQGKDAVGARAGRLGHRGRGTCAVEEGQQKHVQIPEGHLEGDAQQGRKRRGEESGAGGLGGGGRQIDRAYLGWRAGIAEIAEKQGLPPGAEEPHVADPGLDQKVWEPNYFWEDGAGDLRQDGAVFASGFTRTGSSPFRSEINASRLCFQGAYSYEVRAGA